MWEQVGFPGKGCRSGVEHFTKIPFILSQARDGKTAFQSLFFAHGAVHDKADLALPVLSFDGCHLTGQTLKGGTLLIATAMDAERRLLPLAFAIVRSESRSTRAKSSMETPCAP